MFRFGFCVLLFLICFSSLQCTAADEKCVNYDHTYIKCFNFNSSSAVFIARLQEGYNGFNENIIVKKVSLVKSDGKIFWLVHLTGDSDEWAVEVNPLTGYSKRSKNHGYIEDVTSWRSFDELKIVYITDIYNRINSQREKIPRPQKIEEKIWKLTIPLNQNDHTIYEIVYFNAETGASKIVYEDNGVDSRGKWKTLQELDDYINENHLLGNQMFKNPLKQLYA